MSARSDARESEPAAAPGYTVVVPRFAGEVVGHEGGLQLQSRGGYVLRVRDGFPSITCLDCGATSFNPNDVVNRYCGRCAKFHEG